MNIQYGEANQINKTNSTLQNAKQSQPEPKNPA